MIIKQNIQFFGAITADTILVLNQTFIYFVDIVSRIDVIFAHSLAVTLTDFKGVYESISILLGMDTS